MTMIKFPALMATTTLAAGLMALSAPAHADNWGDHEAVIGSITVDTGTANTTNIFQHDNFVKVQGDGDINANWTVNLMQPGSSSTYVLYDIEGDPTFIEGNLNANGQVVIFDKQGTIFANGSIVKVGSILTTTGHISDADLKAGKLNIVDAGNGGPIIINGSITVAEAGLAAFVAPTVINNGVINAKMGKVALASGNTVTLDLYGDNLVEIAVDDKVADGLIENNGVINAEGGTVYMAAQTAKNAVDTVINTSGIVRVSSVEVQGGKIILSGGKKGVVKVSGELAANGTSGGDIKVTGQNVEITQTAQLSADAGQRGNGGTALVYGSDYAIFNGRISARGGALSGNGGDAEISGGESVGFDGTVDLGAINGMSGTLLIDPRHLNISSGGFSSDWAYILSGGVNGTITINDQALANTLRFSNVNLWASETLNTKTDIDLSTWKGLFGSKGITTNDLTLAAPTVNLSHKITLGQGDLNIRDLAPGTSVLGFGIINVPAGGVQVDTINLNAGIYARDIVGGVTHLAGDSQLNSDANTVNVKSDKAFIQQGIWLANDAGGGAVNVSDGIYNENLSVLKSLTLTGTDNAIVDGTGLGGTGLLVRASIVTVDNMTIQNFADGIVNTKGSDIALLNNYIADIKGDGIRVSKNEGVITIIGNEIVGAGDEGIEVHGSAAKGSKEIYINDNIVTNSGDDGIQVQYGTTSVDIKRNTVTDSDSDGIEIRDSHDVDIAKNKISGSHDQGITIEDSSHVRVYKNRVTDILGGEGIYAYNVDGLSILKNKVRDTVGDGIHVFKNTGEVTVAGNKVIRAGDEGIEVHGSAAHGNQAIYIKSNTIIDSDDDGIQVQYGTTSVDVKGNTVQGSGSDGIEVRNSSGVNIVRNIVTGSHNQGMDLRDSTDVSVYRNTIKDILGGEGIYASGIDGLTITRNRVKNISGDGVEVRDSYHVEINDNKIRNIRGDGIQVENVDTVLISGNKITNTDDDGVDLSNADEGRILGNIISTTGDDGIVVYDVGNNFLYGKIMALEEGDVSDSETPFYSLIISDNTITNAGQTYANPDDGEGEDDSESEIEVFTRVFNKEIRDLDGDGIDVSNVSTALIETNTVVNAYDDGIVVTGNESGNGDDQQSDSRNIFYFPWFGMDTNVVIRDNDVTDSGTDGIEIKNMTHAEIDINRVLNSGASGFLASGVYNGDVILTGNIFTDNNIGARFESGLIDLTGAANSFIGGVDGMEFDPATEYAYLGWQEIFVPFEEEGGYYIYIPMFGEMPAELNLVNDTIGTTIFSGPSQYYVELLNGALFNPGTPTILDGLNATYDTINPAAQGGFLTTAQFDQIESKIHHYVDEQTLGLFFYGLIDDADAGDTINDKDTYRVFGGYRPGNGPLSLTITGLPNIPGFSGSIANFLNSIAPAAGNDTERRASTVEELASLEPAAGGSTPPVPAQNSSSAPVDTTTCWGDAMAAASGGSIVNMSFGDGPDSALSNAAACQSGI